MPKNVGSSTTIGLGSIFILLNLALHSSRILRRSIRGLFKKRKWTETNRYGLEITLQHLYNAIPNEENLSHILNMEKQLRQIGLDQDKYDTFIAGSAAERFSKPLLNGHRLSWDSHAIFSDCDIMISPIDYIVSCSAENNQEYFVVESKKPFYMLSETKKLEALRKQLLEEIENNTNYEFIIDECENGPAIKLKKPFQMPSLCFSDYGYDGDMVLAFKCPEWPKNISDWSLRSDMKWPTVSGVEKIKSYGCHFVLKTHPTDNRFKWRISFSRAEIELSTFVPQEARKSYIGLKVIAKDYLYIICGKLTSYHLKNIFLFTLERTDPTFWSTENVRKSFNLILSNLMDCIEAKNCPNFWFSEINMFENFTTRDCKTLLKKLEKIKKQPSKFIEPFNSDLLKDELEAARYEESVASRS